MRHYLYFLYSPKTDRYCIGASKELEKRIARHNTGTSRSTKAGAPLWELKYTEEYESRSAAMKRESYLKRMKSRVFIAGLIQGKQPTFSRHLINPFPK